MAWFPCIYWQIAENVAYPLISSHFKFFGKTYLRFCFFLYYCVVGNCSIVLSSKVIHWCKEWYMLRLDFLYCLNPWIFFKLGHYLKCPKLPIHYWYALDTGSMNGIELEERNHTCNAFDAKDQSGGLGLISVEGFHNLDENIKLP